jgi:hypothetical protein
MLFCGRNLPNPVKLIKVGGEWDFGRPFMGGRRIKRKKDMGNRHESG